jgi:hypothetical protein
VSTLAVASTLFFLFFADLDSTAGADMANSGSDEDGAAEMNLLQARDNMMLVWLQLES